MSSNKYSLINSVTYLDGIYIAKLEQPIDLRIGSLDRALDALDYLYPVLKTKKLEYVREDDILIVFDRTDINLQLKLAANMPEFSLEKTVEMLKAAECAGITVKPNGSFEYYDTEYQHVPDNVISKPINASIGMNAINQIEHTIYGELIDFKPTNDSGTLTVQIDNGNNESMDYTSFSVTYLPEYEHFMLYVKGGLFICFKGI